jgi:hypothetical protein
MSYKAVEAENADSSRLLLLMAFLSNEVNDELLHYTSNSLFAGECHTADFEPRLIDLRRPRFRRNG